MLNTVLFDMGGTLEDIWNNSETLAAVMERLREMLEAAGLNPGCGPEAFQERVLAGLKAYKSWSESVWLEKKPEEIWPDFYLRDFGFDRERLLPITEDLANMWELTYFHRELRPGVQDMLESLKARGYKLGVISNNAGRHGFQRHRLPQAPPGNLPHLPAADAGEGGGLRVCGGHHLPGHHRRQGSGLCQGGADRVPPLRPEGRGGSGGGGAAGCGDYGYPGAHRLAGRNQPGHGSEINEETGKSTCLREGRCFLRSFQSF